jgi:hypothetical protein
MPVDQSGELFEAADFPACLAARASSRCHLSWAFQFSKNFRLNVDFCRAYSVALGSHRGEAMHHGLARLYDRP